MKRNISPGFTELLHIFYSRSTASTLEVVKIAPEIVVQNLKIQSSNVLKLDCNEKASV